MELTPCCSLQWQLHAGRGEIFLQKMDAEAAALWGKFLRFGLLVVENIITWLEYTQYALQEMPCKFDIFSLCTHRHSIRQIAFSLKFHFVRTLYPGPSKPY